MPDKSYNVKATLPDDCKDFDFALIINRIITVLNEGKEHEGEWKRLAQFDHINKARKHLDNWLNSMGDETEDNLGHAITRLAMAIQKEGKCVS